MSALLRGFVGVILITGSTSSTFGESDPACNAPPPATLAEALKARPSTAITPLPYREEILHPAMADPLVTTGFLDVGRGDVLIRHQLTPREEVTEIGTRFITIRRDDYENNVLIPDRLAPLLDALRAIVLERPLSGTDGVLHPHEAGWTATLIPDGLQGALSVEGCGAVLNAVVFAPEGGERRRIVFVPGT